MKISLPKQKSKMYQFYYQKGQNDGYFKGKGEGFQQGVQDSPQIVAQHLPKSKDISLNYDPGIKAEINEYLIQSKWNELNLQDSFIHAFGHPASLVEDRMECLKDTAKSSIWKLFIRVQDATHPIVLKIIKALETNREESVIELNMYLKADEVLSDVMPQIYGAESVHGDAWFLIEYVNPLEGQLSFHPNYFDKIIPSLAKMHSLTYNERFYYREDLFMPWIPIYNTKPIYMERTHRIEETIKMMDIALKIPELEKLIKPYYKELKSILLKGPNYFPELIDAGHSIVHSDLQMNNIACNELSEDNPWDIKFLDWEGAKFNPCWLDVANLIGVFLSYRTDWKAEEEQIIVRCAHLYANEMKNHGIDFAVDPVKLYKMADVQRILEKSLFQQLHWAIDKSYKGVLLSGTLPKISAWSRELGLYHE